MALPVPHPARGRTMALISGLVLAFLILVAERLDGNIECSWIVVFVPIYILLSAVPHWVQQGAGVGKNSHRPFAEVCDISLWVGGSSHCALAWASMVL